MNAAKAAELAARLGTISLFGPATKGLALEPLSASAAE
jgi:hypothetical protein